MIKNVGIPTYRLNDGRFVLAKSYTSPDDGITTLVPVTYANRTQANKRRDEMGPGWIVTGFRPFYVTFHAQEPTP